jgi:putative ABC transport system substrate-binding protein
MKRRAVLFALAAFGVGPRVFAQAAAKLPRIALLDPAEKVGAISEIHPLWGPFLTELRQLGYAEGKTATLERWSGEGNLADFPSLVEKLTATRPDVIVALGLTVIRTVGAATKTIPIVAVGSIPPELRASLARPGGNVTGIHTSLDEQIYAKLAEFMRQLTKPQARIAWLGTQISWDSITGKAAREGAKRAGLALIPVIIRIPLDDAAVRAAVGPIGAARFDGLYLSPEIALRPHRLLIAELVIATRLPSISIYPNDADAGLLVTYGTDLSAAYRRAAHYVDKILKGTKAGDIPIERPTRFELAINRRTAKALGVTIPPDLLLRADRVIE